MSAASRAAFHPGHCQVGPHLVYVGAGALFVGLLCFVGPLCKCDVGLDILWNCVVSFVCFRLNPCMDACNPRITKTYGNG